MRRTWLISVQGDYAQFVAQVRQRVALLVQSRTLGQDGQPVRREIDLTEHNASLRAVWNHVQAQRPLPSSVMVQADFQVVNGRVEQITFSAGHLPARGPTGPDAEAAVAGELERPPAPLREIRQLIQRLTALRRRLTAEHAAEGVLESFFTSSNPSNPSPSRGQCSTSPPSAAISWALQELRRIVGPPPADRIGQIEHFRRAIDILYDTECGWVTSGCISALRARPHLAPIRQDMVALFEEQYAQTYEPPPCNPGSDTVIGRIWEQVFRQRARPPGPEGVSWQRQAPRSPTRTGISR